MSSQSDAQYGGWNTQPLQQHLSSGQGETAGGGDPQAATVAAMQAGAQAPTGGQGSQAQPQQGNDFLQSILEQVDPAHRTIVEPYVQKWNSGVTRRFQELHGELSPYKELGADPETLGNAYQLYQMLDENPEGVLALIQEAIGQQGPEGAPGQQPQGLGDPLAPQGDPQQVQPQGGLPPELAERFNTFESVLEAMAEKFLDQQTTQTAEAEDAQLDQYLGHLKNEFGDFDEQFVVAKMMAGSSGEQAVQAYNAAIQAQVDKRSRTPNVGPILGGGGAVPQGGKSVTDASAKETKALVAQILAASQQS